MTITDPIPEALDDDQLDDFERLLQAMLKERVRPVSADATEAARHRAQTRSLEAALARIAAGTFGSCRWCRALIDVKRLEVVPQAQGCLACTAGRR
ncbi:hypothetical protein BH10ACT1_BH10ACT1_03300 [soil metagenome]